MDSFPPAPNQFPNEKDPQGYWTSFTDNDSWIHNGLDASALIQNFCTPVSPPMNGPSLNTSGREIDLSHLLSDTVVSDTPVHSEAERSLAQLIERVKNLEEV